MKEETGPCPNGLVKNDEASFLTNPFGRTNQSDEIT
jgi:hypothetical protein